jgi:hypothetical protein
MDERALFLLIVGFVAGVYSHIVHVSMNGRRASLPDALQLSDLPTADLRDLEGRDRAELRAIAADLQPITARLSEVERRVNEHNMSYYNSGVFVRDTPKTPVEHALSEASRYIRATIETLGLPGAADGGVAKDQGPMERLKERGTNPRVDWEPASGIVRLTVDLPRLDGTRAPSTLVGVDAEEMALRVLQALDKAEAARRAAQA